ncbi:MAG: hypothetical protein LC667_01815 [Thioalkalivibrio sp.]|nr:hypothetical protein [Thioalkalivibrio sp.]
MYLDVPPDRLQQGCLVEAVFFDAVRFELPAVVLSPACDFAQDNAEYATCIALWSFGEMVPRLVRGSWSDIVPGVGRDPTAKQKKKFSDYMSALIGGRVPRYHWFDRMQDGRGPWIADFQLVTTVERAEFGSLAIIAGLTSQFMEQLPSRWVSYAGRIGTPDRDSAFLDAIIGEWEDRFFDAAKEDTPAGTPDAG